MMQIDNREERNRQAHAVIAVMGNLQPTLRDTADFAHKLWDHLFIMSDFQLDVDSPYPRPTRQDLTITPSRMPYSQGRIEFKHYGKYVARTLRALCDEPNREARNVAINSLARYMRAKSFEYNLEHPNNEIIIKDIKKMSDYGIDIDEQSLNNIRSDYKQHLSAHPQRNKGKQAQTKGKGRTAQQQLQKNRQKSTNRHTNSHNTNR
jgi:hypothetical protein